MISASKYIENHIKELNPGTILFPSDFRGAGSENAIKLVLSRLAQEGIIERLGHGIYYFPQYDDELGKLTPSMGKNCKSNCSKRTSQDSTNRIYSTQSIRTLYTNSHERSLLD